MYNERYFTDQEVAELLQIKHQSLIVKLAKGDNLPPYIRPHGLRSRLWKKDEVFAWIEGGAGSREPSSTVRSRIRRD